MELVNNSRRTDKFAFSKLYIVLTVVDSQMCKCSQIQAKEEASSHLLY